MDEDEDEEGLDVAAEVDREDLEREERHRLKKHLTSQARPNTTVSEHRAAEGLAVRRRVDRDLRDAPVSRYAPRA